MKEVPSAIACEGELVRDKQSGDRGIVLRRRHHRRRRCRRRQSSRRQETRSGYQPLSIRRGSRADFVSSSRVTRHRSTGRQAGCHSPHLTSFARRKGQAGERKERSHAGSCLSDQRKRLSANVSIALHPSSQSFQLRPAQDEREAVGVGREREAVGE